MNGFNDKGLQAIWDGLGLPADIRMQEGFERLVCEWAEERIVRCRDCKHHSNEPWEHYNGSVTTSNCWYFGDYEGTPAAVEPDGFCKCGERK